MPDEDHRAFATAHHEERPLIPEGIAAFVVSCPSQSYSLISTRINSLPMAT